MRKVCINCSKSFTDKEIRRGRPRKYCCKPCADNYLHKQKYIPAHRAIKQGDTAHPINYGDADMVLKAIPSDIRGLWHAWTIKKGVSLETLLCTMTKFIANKSK